MGKQGARRSQKVPQGEIRRPPQQQQSPQKVHWREIPGPGIIIDFRTTRQRHFRQKVLSDFWALSGSYSGICILDHRSQAFGLIDFSIGLQTTCSRTRPFVFDKVQSQLATFAFCFGKRACPVTSGVVMPFRSRREPELAEYTLFLQISE